MLSKIFIFCCCLFVFSGCMYTQEPMPVITNDYTPTKPTKMGPVILKPTRPQTDTYGAIPRNWLPPTYSEKRWTAIVIHHSGTENGDAAIFDKWHREGNHWEGVGYDFVIGNGTDSGNGLVEVTFRWFNQQQGAHCGGTPGNWANVEAVGICLVGNFNNTAPTTQQMNSLVKLVRFLQNRYRIPKSRIYGHGTTPGYPGKTSCPGRKFPMAWLKSTLEF